MEEYTIYLKIYIILDLIFERHKTLSRIKYEIDVCKLLSNMLKVKLRTKRLINYQFQISDFLKFLKIYDNKNKVFSVYDFSKIIYLNYDDY